MFYPIIAALVFSCLLLHSPHVHAIQVNVTLTPQEIQLTGLNAEAKFFINVDAAKDRKTEPVLTLSWLKSQLIDTRKSTFSIVLDGRIRRTMRLADMEAGAYTIRLPGMQGGDHQLTIRASLQVDDDPCLLHRKDDAWLTIKPDTRISWERSVAKPQLLAIHSIPASWQRLAQGPSGVLIEYQAALDPAGMGAYLDANQLVRRWAYEPELANSERTVGHMRLTTVDKLAVDNAVAKRLRQAAPARFALAIDSQGILSVIGLDTTALREALLLLSDDSARGLCRDAVCTSNTQIIRTRPAIGVLRPSDEPPTQVWQLGTSGSSNGWTAKGIGQHQMRFVWRRPATWKVQEWPTLQVHALASSSATLDPNKSAISVRINERPVATYSLAQWKSEKAEVKVPRDFWEAGEWVVDIVANLQPVESKGCSYFDEESNWVSILPETALSVPRQEQAYEGIASFFNESSQSDLPILTIEQPSLQRLAGVAAVLYPFVKPKPGQVWQERAWRVENLAACAAKRCIQVRSATPADATLQYGPSVWNDTSGELRIPQVETRDTLGLFYLAPQKLQPSQMLVVVGPASEKATPLEPPDYRGLLGRIALFSKTWHVLDVRAPGQDGPTILSPDQIKKRNAVPNISAEQSNLRWLNFVWAGVSILVIAILLIRLWRKPKSKKVDDHWEMHE